MYSTSSQETPEAPPPLDAPLGASAVPATPTSQFFTFRGAAGNAASGAGGGDETAAAGTTQLQAPASEITSAQLEAWRAADRYLVDNPLAERGTPLAGMQSYFPLSSARQTHNI